MNERIRELCRLADVHILPDDSEYGHCIIGLEKFAELIIREILSYAQDGDLDFMKFMIKKNFGIEE